MNKLKFNYFYNGTPITKKQFESAIDNNNWFNELDEFGQFSFGYYRAIIIE